MAPTRASARARSGRKAAAASPAVPRRSRAQKKTKNAPADKSMWDRIAHLSPTKAAELGARSTAVSPAALGSTVLGAAGLEGAADGDPAEWVDAAGAPAAGPSASAQRAAGAFWRALGAVRPT